MSLKKIALFTAVVISVAACGNGNQNSSQTGSTDAAPASEQNAPEAAGGEHDAAATEMSEPLEVSVMDNGLEIQVIAEGEGDEIQNGQTAVVHYTGWFYDESAPDNKGSQFDSSRDRGDYFPFPVGAGRVIAGWDQGVLGMKVGERRILIVPSELAYGQAGHPAGIPPNSKLMFDVELFEIQ